MELLTQVKGLTICDSRWRPFSESLYVYVGVEGNKIIKLSMAEDVVRDVFCDTADINAARKRVVDILARNEESHLERLIKKALENEEIKKELEERQIGTLRVFQKDLENKKRK